MAEIDTDELRKLFDKQHGDFSRLKDCMTDAITSILEEEGISYLNVSGRVKEFDSFLQKAEEKNYSDPLEDNEDFVGVRVISYFLDDLEKICEAIDKHFNVLKTEDKAENLGEREFGYRSVHKIICIPDSWCESPIYKNLSGIKCELQVRTILMHAWAEVEHKLKYKNSESVPKVISRKFTTTSGMFENIDIQFQEMRSQVSQHIVESKEKLKNVDKGEVEINHETLKLYLRENHSKLVGVPVWPAGSEDLYSTVVAELKKAGYKTLSDLDVDLKKALPAFKKSNRVKHTSEIGWLRNSLRRVNPKYPQRS